MKSYNKIIASIFVLILVLSCVNILSTSADNSYAQPDKFIYGDVDSDGNVTIKDATFIQKDLAKIQPITAVQKYLADPDCAGYSIKNATAIQKYLAKYETYALWGAELIMASQDEFSKRVSTDDEFSYEYILVCVKSNVGIDYTVEDFPEYDFESLEFYLPFENIGLDLYKLYLQTPSRENILKAIEALDYRANIDVAFVEPDYIYYVAYD